MKKSVSLLMICIFLLSMFACGTDDATIQPEIDNQISFGDTINSSSNPIGNQVFPLSPENFMQSLTQKVESDFESASYEWVESNNFLSAELTYGNDHRAFFVFHHPESLDYFTVDEINDEGIFCIAAYFLYPSKDLEAIFQENIDSNFCIDDFIFCCDTSLSPEEINLIEVLVESSYKDALTCGDVHGLAHYNNICYDYMQIPEEFMEMIGYADCQGFSFTVNPVIFSNASSPVAAAFDFSPQYFCDFLYELETAVVDKYIFDVQEVNGTLVCVIDVDPSIDTNNDYDFYGAVRFFTDNNTPLCVEELNEVGRFNTILLDVPYYMADIIHLVVTAADTSYLFSEEDLSSDITYAMITNQGGVVPYKGLHIEIIPMGENEGEPVLRVAIKVP